MNIKKILITAFEPFGGEEINPSWETAKLLESELESELEFNSNNISNNIKIIARCLPCVFETSLIELEKNIQEIQPDIVISLGQAGGRPDITPEFVAINWDDARIPDNAGHQPCDEKIIDNQEYAPNAYFSTLPVKSMVYDLQNQGIPASVSYTAGTFVCNHVFYGLQHIAPKYGIKQSGFVHIPYLPSQAAKIKNAPSMSQETLLRALKIMIQSILEYNLEYNLESNSKTKTQIKIIGGTTH